MVGKSEVKRRLTRQEQADDRNNTECILRKCSAVWSGFVWLGKGSSDRFLLSREWTFEFHVGLKILWPAERPSTFEEGPCSIELLSSYLTGAIPLPVNVPAPIFFLKSSFYRQYVLLFVPLSTESRLEKWRHEDMLSERDTNRNGRIPLPHSFLLLLYIAKNAQKIAVQTKTPFRPKPRVSHCKA